MPSRSNDDNKGGAIKTHRRFIAPINQEDGKREFPREVFKNKRVEVPARAEIQPVKATGKKRSADSPRMSRAEMADKMRPDIDLKAPYSRLKDGSKFE